MAMTIEIFTRIRRGAQNITTPKLVNNKKTLALTISGQSGSRFIKTSEA